MCVDIRVPLEVANNGHSQGCSLSFYRPTLPDRIPICISYILNVLLERAYIVKSNNKFHTSIIL